MQPLPPSPSSRRTGLGARLRAGLLGLACSLSAASVSRAVPVEATEPSSSPASVVGTGVARAETFLGPATNGSLQELLEETRRLADSGGPEADAALLRWEFLSRVLREVSPPPGPDLASLETELQYARQALQAFQANPGAAEVGARSLADLSEEISEFRELSREWQDHRVSLEAELRSYQEEFRLAQAREDDDDLEERALEEAVARFQGYVDNSTRGTQVVQELVRVLEQQYSELRLRERTGEEDLQRKREELEALEADLRERASRAAELLRQARATERRAEEAQRLFESRRQSISDEETQRVYELKTSLEGEQKELALERGVLARAEQELAEARAARKRDEIRFLALRRKLEESGGPAPWVRARLEESRQTLENLEVSEASERQRSDRALALLDRLRGVRRGYRQRNEDLLAPDLAEAKKGAGWVLRTILSVLDDRESVGEDLRDRRAEILDELGFRRRDEEAWSETLEAALPVEAGPSRPGLRHLAQVIYFGGALLEGVRSGIPQELARELQRRGLRVLRGETLAPLGPSILLALLHLVLFTRLLRILSLARQQAVLQADAFDAGQARRVRTVTCEEPESEEPEEAEEAGAGDHPGGEADPEGDPAPQGGPGEAPGGDDPGPEEGGPPESTPPRSGEAS